MIGRYSLASVSIQSGILAVQPLSLSLSFSIVLSSSSIFHATFNYERLSRCQGDVTREVTGRKRERERKNFSFIGAHAYCTSRLRRVDVAAAVLTVSDKIIKQRERRSKDSPCLSLPSDPWITTLLWLITERSYATAFTTRIRNTPFINHH